MESWTRRGVSVGGRSYQCPASGCLPVNASKEQHTVGGHPVYAKNVSPPPPLFILENDHFTKTGLGQTQGKLRNKAAFPHQVWAAVFEGGMGYRNDTTSGVATGDEPESIYMVASGTHYNDGCCFDYGNAELDMKDDGTGTMEAVYFGNASGGSMNHGAKNASISKNGSIYQDRLGTNRGKALKNRDAFFAGGRGAGPWVMADLEKGLWGANVTHSNEPALRAEYVTVCRTIPWQLPQHVMTTCCPRRQKMLSFENKCLCTLFTNRRC